MRNQATQATESPADFDRQAFHDTNGEPGESEGPSGHGDTLRDSSPGGILREGNVIWVLVNDRQLAIFDALDTTLLQANNPPSSLQVGYGSYAQAYAALERARPTETVVTPPVLAAQGAPLDLDNPTRGLPYGPSHRSVQTAQSLPSSSRLNDPTHAHTSPTNAHTLYSYTPPATGGLRTPLGSSATPPRAPRLAHPPLPPSTEGLRTPLGSSAPPPMARRLAPPRHDAGAYHIVLKFVISR